MVKWNNLIYYSSNYVKLDISSKSGILQFPIQFPSFWGFYVREKILLSYNHVVLYVPIYIYIYVFFVKVGKIKENTWKFAL